MLFPLPFLLSFGFVHSSLFFFRQFFTSKQSQCPRKTSFLSFCLPPQAAREKKEEVGDTSVAVAATPNPGRVDPAPLKFAPIRHSKFNLKHGYMGYKPLIVTMYVPGPSSYLSC